MIQFYVDEKIIPMISQLLYLSYCCKFVMSLQGVKQLKELLIRYSDYDGSSKGIRDWMRLSLVTFALKNPEFIIKTQLKRNVHPFVRGYYLNGNDKTICIKNQSPESIEGYINDLRNQVGRKVTKRTFQ